MRREVPKRELFDIGIYIYSDIENGLVYYFRYTERSVEAENKNIKGGRVRRSENLARH